MFKDNKKSASLVLTTLSAGMLASPRSEVHAAWYDFLWYLVPTFLWNYLFINTDKDSEILIEENVETKKKERGGNDCSIKSGSENFGRSEKKALGIKDVKNVEKNKDIEVENLNNVKKVKKEDRKSHINLDNKKKTNHSISLPRDEEIERCIKDLIYKKCSDDKGRSAKDVFVDKIYNALKPDLNEVKEKMKESLEISLEDAVVSTSGSKIEDVIKKRRLIEKNRCEALDILKNLKREVDKNRIRQESTLVYVPFPGDLAKDVKAALNFSLPLFTKTEGVSPKKFARIIVKEDRIKVCRFIDTTNEDEVKILYKGISDNLVEVDTFKEILLEDEDALEKVNALANKILRINSLFDNLYKICEKLNVSVGKSNLSVSFNFKDNKVERLYIAAGENDAQRYVSSITVGAKAEEIKVFYCEINNVNTGVLEYNLTKSEDMNALAEIFSEENIKNISSEEGAQKCKRLDEVSVSNESNN